MYLKNSFTSLTFILLLASCVSDNKSSSDDIPLLYSSPKSFNLNTEEGYIINQFTGDSIQTLVNSSGDTLKTGVSIPIIGKAIHPDSVTKPKIINAGEPKAISSIMNITKTPDPLIVRVDKSSLNSFTIDVDISSFVLVNSTGDTLPSGVPIPINGRIVPFIQPKPVKALPPRMKDNASINIKYMDVEQGMSSPHIRYILEDKRGNLWFATGGEGVSVYNGETFMHFSEKEGLSNDMVWTILEDSSGRLWFGTWGGGVCMLNGESIIHFTEKEGLSNNRVSSILEDSQGNFWFGTWGGGVSKYNGETITHFTEKEGLSDNFIQSILEDSHGKLWFGTRDGGVNMFNGHTLPAGQASITHYTEEEGLSNNSVSCICEDSNGYLWFGTKGGGLNMFKGDTFTHFTTNEGLSNNYINSIFEDSKGNLWFGTEQGGVSMYNGDSFSNITEKEGLSDNTVISIIEDSHGNLWFGTDYEGVSIYNSESFRHLTKKQGLSDNRILSIHEDNQGNLWFGTMNGGVDMYDSESIMHFTKKEGFSNKNVLSIYEDSNGNLWFGTENGGVIMYDGKTLPAGQANFTHFTENEGLSSNNVRSILEDSQGNLWFGTFRGGVSKYDGESFTHFTEAEGMSNNYVLSIQEDRYDNLWFGTFGGGVSFFDGKTFKHITEKEGLSNNNVMSILEDSYGNLWFGTYGGGVNLYNGEAIVHITEKEGLSHNTVQSIMEDNNNNIWISTEKGLNLIAFDPDSVNGTFNNPVIHNYSRQDGLKGMHFFLNSVHLDSKNRIWWGSGKSLTILNMNNFKIQQKIPIMQLNQIDINQKLTDFRHLEESFNRDISFTGIKEFYNYPLGLEVAYSNNHFTFYFSAIDWTAPHKIRYSYKMENLNDRWSLPTTEAKAEYRNLPKGTYTFKVRAIGGAQKWSKSFDYTFAIKPPWWRTWWAILAYGLCGVLIVMIIARLRTFKLKQRQRELEAEVINATLIIRSQKEEVENQRDEIEEQKEEIETQRDEVVATNEALEKQKCELEFTVENLKMTQSQLIQSEKMASVGVLTAGIAHELNNPINFVSSNVNPLLRDVNDVFTIIRKYEEIVKSNNLEGTFDEVDELKAKMDYSFVIKEIIKLLEGIDEGAKRSSQIVKGLRSFSRLDDEKYQLYDIHEGIDSTLILLNNKIKNRIKIRKDYGIMKKIECFPGKLNQVLLNILTNSIQAIDGKGEIFIQTVSSEIGVKIVITDTGKGMTPEVKKHIFDPFYTTKDVGKGTGLGLSISYGIIEQHNGNIDVISKSGKGTEFIISLPFSRAN